MADKSRYEFSIFLCRWGEKGVSVWLMVKADSSARIVTAAPAWERRRGPESTGEATETDERRRGSRSRGAQRANVCSGPVALT